MRLPIQEHASDSGIAWTSAMKGGRPWITALLCLVIAVGLTGLQEKKWGSSVSNAMVWPVIFWAFSAASFLFNGLAGKGVVILLSLVVWLVGFVVAGLVLYKGKEIGRRSDTSHFDDVAPGLQKGI
jgi:hypothetical protein